MSSISDDTEAQLSMMRDAYVDLRTRNPNHELLRLAELHQDEGGFNFSPDYRRRCVRNDDKWKVQGFARYTFALEAAVSGAQIKLLDTNPPCRF